MGGFLFVLQLGARICICFLGEGVVVSVDIFYVLYSFPNFQISQIPLLTTLAGPWQLADSVGHSFAGSICLCPPFLSKLLSLRQLLCTLGCLLYLWGHPFQLWFPAIGILFIFIILAEDGQGVYFHVGGDSLNDWRYSESYFILLAYIWPLSVSMFLFLVFFSLVCSLIILLCFQNEHNSGTFLLQKTILYLDLLYLDFLMFSALTGRRGL